MPSDDASAGGRASDSFEVTVLATPDAPAVARRVLSAWLDGSLREGVLEDAKLLLSELVTNCLLHADLATDDSIWIRAQLNLGNLRLEVRDAGEHGTAKPRAPSTTGGGFGLHLVDLLAARWGVSNSGGTHVWLEL